MRIVIAFAAALTLISASAHAERIQVAKFRGSRRVARAVRKDVIQVIRKGNDLVKRDAAGVIKAKIRKRGHKYAVRLYLIDRFGDTAKKIGFHVSRRGMSSHQKRLLRKKLRSAIAHLPKAEPEVADDDGFDEDDDVADAGDADADADDDPVEEAKHDDDTAEDSGVSRSVGAPSALPDAEVSAGFSVIRRKFTFGADQGNYDGVLAGGAYVEAQIYPLAFGAKSKNGLDVLKRRIGFGLEYDHSLGLKSSFPEDPNTQLATTQSRLSVDARYRHPFNKGPRSPMVIVSLGYEKLAFTIDRTAAPAGVTIMVPNTNYTSVTPGASVWYPLSDKVALAASAHVKLVLGAGDVTTGPQYGTGSAFGYDADGGLQYDVSKKVMIRAGGYLARVSLSLDGNGDLSAMGNFTSASDTYLGFYATGGFRL